MNKLFSFELWPLQAAPVSFWHAPISLSAHLHFLAQDIQLTLYFPYLRLEIGESPGGDNLFLQESDTLFTFSKEVH